MGGLGGAPPASFLHSCCVGSLVRVLVHFAKVCALVSVPDGASGVWWVTYLSGLTPVGSWWGVLVCWTGARKWELSGSCSAGGFAHGLIFSWDGHKGWRCVYTGSPVKTNLFFNAQIKAITVFIFLDVVS